MYVRLNIMLWPILLMCNDILSYIDLETDLFIEGERELSCRETDHIERVVM